MATKSLGLWMLFLLIQEGVFADAEDTVCQNVTGIQGRYAELECCYPEKDLSNSFRVQWQLQDKVNCIVYSYFSESPDSKPLQCERYKNRAELFGYKNRTQHLRLFNVSLEDSKIYECILQEKKKGMYQKIFRGQIRLEVVEKNYTANETLNGTYEKPSTASPITDDKQQQTQVIAISLAAAVVIITVSIWILYKRKDSLHRAYTAPVGMDMS